MITITEQTARWTANNSLAADALRRHSTSVLQERTNVCGTMLIAVAISPLLAMMTLSSHAAGISLETAPPVVVKTVPVAGATDVDPDLTELRVTFSKPMQDGSWSWSTWGEENFPKMSGDPRYLPDGRTCVLPVRLEPDKFYATWLNSDKFKNFEDRESRPAVPYLLTFTTAGKALGRGAVASRGYEYTVQAGNTLRAIAQAYCGQGTPVTVDEILKANPGLNGSRLQVGQTIFIPEMTTSGSAGAAESSFPQVSELPGERIFHGRYQHRSRGRDIDTPSELWLNQSPDGSLTALASLPFRQTSELASGDSANRLTGYRIEGEGAGDQSGYRIDLVLAGGKAFLTRRGVRQDVDGKELEVPEQATFDPNTRPDSYCAANILLRALALVPGETTELRMYDWDNSGEALVDYTIQVRHAGKERVEVPAGTFEANHLVLQQLTSADTWFKKRAGHVTEFWMLDNHVIVRVLRHREPYEMILLDYTFPEQLEGSVGARTFVRVVLDGDQMTFEGREVSWKSLDDALALVPDPASTVLEWAVPSTQITIQQQTNWTGRFTKLAQQHGFEYSSYVGVQPFGSKGGMPQTVRPASGSGGP